MTNDELYERLNNVFRDVFDDESICVNENTTANDIDDWDSLSHISLIAAIEGEFGIRFDMKDVLKMKNVGEMVQKIGELAAR